MIVNSKMFVISENIWEFKNCLQFKKFMISKMFMLSKNIHEYRKQIMNSKCVRDFEKCSQIEKVVHKFENS